MAIIGSIIAAVAAQAIAAVAVAATGAPADRLEPVDRRALVRAMAAEGSYDLTKTTNAARFQATVYLRVARTALAVEDGPRALFISHEDWHRAYLEVTGLTAEAAPAFMRAAFENRQDTVLDFRPGKVVREIEDHHPAPDLAMNVRIFWDPQVTGRRSFSYDDRDSVPELRISNDHEVTFRLLEFPREIVFDQVRGTRVRPTSGALGVLFRLLGQASVRRVRLTVTPDNVQLVRGKARKLFLSVDTTVTVRPDGTMTRGLPPGRSDLRVFEHRLRRPLQVTYEELDWEALARGDGLTR